MPRPGFEPGLLRPQRRVLTTRRSRLIHNYLFKQLPVTRVDVCHCCWAGFQANDIVTIDNF